MRLGVNIDHVATIRNARGEGFPSPVHAAFVALEAGASNITCHLREDRRHIKDEDIALISRLTGKLNMEMAAEDEIINIALMARPVNVTIVPEKRQELTTEGGLDVIKNRAKLKDLNKLFNDKGITTSAFIEPDISQINASKESGFNFIEIHTGNYAREFNNRKLEDNTELRRIKDAVSYGNNIGLKVNAGHGLDYKNIKNLAAIKGIYEFNIGYSIISHSLFYGLSEAVREMALIIKSFSDNSSCKDEDTK